MHPFTLDQFQKEAIEAVEAGASVLVSAPTGAGKTVIAEYVVQRCLEEGGGVIYTAPIKALSNQKFREFQSLFPDDVGIITGDVRINTAAPLLIMTTEIFRNAILEDREGFKAHRWIIFDEIHYLDDRERGTVWEESLIFLPEHMHFIGLSATIPNVREFSSWLARIHPYDIVVVEESRRPVPLHFMFQSRGRIIDNLSILRRMFVSRAGRQRRGGGSVKTRAHSEPAANSPIRLIRHLRERERCPVIYFAFSRKRCEFLASTSLKLEFLSDGDRRAALELFDDLAHRFHVAADHRSQTLREMVARGIAYHHAGIHPMLKEIIEQLFSRRLIRVIFTTETFALGINMPARTVVIDDVRKKYGKFHRILKTRDFHQMAGRSGRRGIDREGFVYCRISPGEVGFKQLEKMLSGSPEPIVSRFSISYATILNLYQRYGDQLIDVYNLSFHFHQQMNRKKNRQMDQIHARLRILKHQKYIQDGRLTTKGEFARQIYGYEMPMAELFAEGMLENLQPLQLGVLCLAMVYEPRPREARARLAHRFKKMRSLSVAVSRRIQETERQNNISPPSKRFFYHLSPALIAWMDGAPLVEILGHMDKDEGEIIRYFRMAVQILREIRETPVSAELKRRIDRAINRINRDDINAEEQLRDIVDNGAWLES